MMHKIGSRSKPAAHNTTKIGSSKISLSQKRLHVNLLLSDLFLSVMIYDNEEIKSRVKY
jgi:hypothetical protein